MAHFSHREEVSVKVQANYVCYNIMRSGLRQTFLKKRELLLKLSKQFVYALTSKQKKKKQTYTKHFTQMLIFQNSNLEHRTRTVDVARMMICIDSHPFIYHIASGNLLNVIHVHPYIRRTVGT